MSSALTHDEEIDRLALVLAQADGAIRGNTYAETAYNAGVDMAIDYWKALASAAMLHRDAADPDDQLLDAIAHGRDEDVEGRVIVMPLPPAMVAVSHIDRTRDELNAIADMLRAATTKEAIENAHARLGRHLADHP